jgi:uncharacterized protein (DUF2384 family)
VSRNARYVTGPLEATHPDRLLELHYVTQALRDLYTHEGAEIWLHGRKRSLDGRRPVDMLADGAYEEVLDAIESKRSGAM